MHRSVIALVSGSLFGSGFAISGMIDPSRVRGFLDIFGKWDPTLVFVMGGAVAVMAIAWMVQRKLEKPLAGGQFSLPDTTKIDSRLIVGALLFGAGWGVAGLCPGPALAAFIFEPGAALIFGVSLVGGMAIFQMTVGKSRSVG